MSSCEIDIREREKSDRNETEKKKKNVLNSIGNIISRHFLTYLNITKISCEAQMVGNGSEFILNSGMF